MKYLVLAAGMGKRLNGSAQARPKCLIEVQGETLIERLVRQIRQHDSSHDINVVVGFKYPEVAAKIPGCSLFVNPFFDITGINASIWFGKGCFDADILMINGDIVFSDELIRNIIGCNGDSHICYDSSILDPKEINLRVADNRVVRFGVNFKDYSGAYAGVIKFSKNHAQLFVRLLDDRIKKGFNEPRTYYFSFIRQMIIQYNVHFYPFDFAEYAWAEIDYVHDLVRARELFD
jgi:L-glutamine-phosphate cytidylyltransferase